MPLPPLPLAPLLVPGTAEAEVEGVLTPEPGTDAPVEPEKPADVAYFIFKYIRLQIG